MLTLEQALSALQQQQLIAYPTEAVYGLGCLAKAERALERLIALKARDPQKGVILIAASIEQLTPFIAPLSDQAIERIGQSWPGPTTWVVPAASGISVNLSGGRKTIAVRVTAHPVARALCLEANSALVSTSANRSGEPPLVSAAAIEAAFGQHIAGVLEGQLGGRTRPSDIFDLQSGRQLR